MANIVNTPIIMSVNESALALEESSIKNLMEYNTYPVKIYTNENLGNDVSLVKKTQNDQTLIKVGVLEKDVKKLLRSTDENENTIDWWVYLENLNETGEVEIGETNTTVSLYGGILKTYSYEEVPTIIPNVTKRTNCEIKELGQLQVYFTDENFEEFEIYKNPTLDLNNEISNEILKSGQFAERLSNLPRPKDDQVELEVPKEISISNLGLELPAGSFKVLDKLELKETTLKLEAYNEEEGIYYYQKNIKGKELTENEEPFILEAETIPLDEQIIPFNLKVEVVEIDLNCKINEDNFGIYNLEATVELEPKMLEEELASDELKETETSREVTVKTNEDLEIIINSLELTKEQFGGKFDFEAIKFENIVLSSTEKTEEKEGSIYYIYEANLQTGLNVTRNSNDTPEVIGDYENPDIEGGEDNNEEELIPIDSDKVGVRLSGNITCKFTEEELSKLLRESLNDSDEVPSEEDYEDEEDLLEIDDEGSLNGNEGEEDLSNEETGISLEKQIEISCTLEMTKDVHTEYKNEALLLTEIPVEITYNNLTYTEEEVDMSEILFDEQGDDYAYIYTLEKEYEADEYNKSGLNEFYLGLRSVELDEDENEKTTYITNSVTLQVIPSIATEDWMTANYFVKYIYIGNLNVDQDKFSYIEQGETKEAPKDIRNLYINKKVGADNEGNLTKISLYEWSPSKGKYVELEIKNLEQTSTT